MTPTQTPAAIIDRASGIVGRSPASDFDFALSMFLGYIADTWDKQNIITREHALGLARIIIRERA